MEKDIILDVKNLKTYYHSSFGTLKAVQDVSFSVKRGTILGIVGESGCGKSVTARSIINIIQPPGKIESGEVIYYGGDKPVDLLSLPQKSKELQKYRGKEIAMIFQEPMTCLSPVYTVGSQMTEAIRLYYPEMTKEQARKYAIDLLRDVGLNSPEKQIDSYVFELSGGMRQRVLIAIALSGNPKLIIADEPTTAVDVTIQDKIMKLLKEIQRKNDLSIIIITHNMGVIAQLSDEVVVMYLGSIVEKCTTKELFSNPSHPYTQKLIQSIPAASKTYKVPLKTIEGDIPNPYTLKDECPFRNRCDFGASCKNRPFPPFSEISPGHFVRCYMCGKERQTND